jgi:transcriptional regulator GlxA family with amidase domain
MNEPIKFAFTLYEHMLLTSVTLPAEMLRAGEAFAKSHLGNEFRPISISWLSESTQNIASSFGINVKPTGSYSDLCEHDFVLVPSIWRNPRPIINKKTQLSCELKQAWLSGSTLIAVGTGVCFLAESDLLDNHPATTHWHYAKQFEKMYPRVNLKPEFFITQSERIYTVASLNALADVIVHIISNLYGTEAALHVQQNFSHEIRKPYEDQRYLEGKVDLHPDELIADIQFWIKNNYHSDISIKSIAEKFNISLRTLNRRFKLATNQSPAFYIQTIRLDTAKDLLSSSNLSIHEIAISIGFNSQALLTRLFKERLGQTPSHYRKVVRRKLFHE